MTDDNGEQAASFVRIEFTPDGQMLMHAEGNIGAPQFWAAGHMLTLWGDSAFTADQLRQQQTNGGKIAIPNPGALRRLHR